MSAFCFYVISRSSNEQEKRALCNCLLDRLSVTHISQHITSSGVTLPFGAPLLIFFAAPTKILVSKKQQKKVATFFSVFLKGFLHPWGFSYPKYFFCVDRTLSWPRYGPFYCLVERLKNSKFCNMPLPPPPPPPPPKVPPLHSRGSRSGR